jgi:hypothetical protein
MTRTRSGDVASRLIVTMTLVAATALALGASEPLGGTWARPQPTRTPTYWEHTLRGQVDAFTDVEQRTLGPDLPAIQSVVYDLFGSDPGRIGTWQAIYFDGYDASGISLERRTGAESDKGAACFASFVGGRPSLPVEQARMTAVSLCQDGPERSSSLRLPLGGVFTIYGAIGNARGPGFGLDVTFSIDGGDLVATVRPR